METTNSQQPTPSQEPDFEKIALLLEDATEECKPSFFYVISATLQKLYNNPVAFDMFLEGTLHGTIDQWAVRLSKATEKELTLNSEIAAFKRQVERLEAELKDVREMRDRLIFKIKEIVRCTTYDPCHNNGKPPTDLLNLISEAEAQKEGEK